MVDASDWRPIETALKSDIVLLTDGGYVVSGFWNRDCWMCGWTTDWVHLTVKIQPTHWMPLLPPPVMEPTDG